MTDTGEIIVDFYAQIVKRVVNLNLHIVEVAFGKLTTPVGRIISYFDADILAMVDDFYAKIIEIIIDFKLAVQRKYFAVGFASDGAVILVDNHLFEFDFLCARADGGQQCGKQDCKKQFFHSV